MNVSKLSNNELIEMLVTVEGHIDPDSDLRKALTEAQLRLAHVEERERALMHIVPETIMCSLVENANPNSKISLGGAYQIIEAAVMAADQAVSEGCLENMIKQSKFIEKARTSARKEIHGDDDPLLELITRLKH